MKKFFVLIISGLAILNATAQTTIIRENKDTVTTYLVESEKDTTVFVPFTYKVKSALIGQVIKPYIPVLVLAPPSTPPVQLDNVDTVTQTPTVASGYTLTYQNGFNVLNDLTNNNGQYGNGTVVNNPKTEGAGAFRSRPANVSAGIRSEWQSGTSAQNPTEGAVEYDTYYNYIVKNQCHVVQWHPNTGGSSACLSIWHNGGKFVAMYNNGEKQNANWNTPQTQPTMTIQTGKWYHIRIEYKFSLTDGYYRVFIDGKPYASYNGKLGDGSGQYFKLGFNGGFDGNTAEAMKSDIIYDNLKIYKKQ